MNANGIGALFVLFLLGIVWRVLWVSQDGKASQKNWNRWMRGVGIGYIILVCGALGLWIGNVIGILPEAGAVVFSVAAGAACVVDAIHENSKTPKQ